MSSCTSCGGSTTSTGGNCPRCEPEMFAQIPVERQRALDPCEGEGACPELDKFWEEITAQFIMPAIGSASGLKVCDSGRFHQGQWVFLPGAGKLRVDSILDGTTLNVHNGCADGTGIVGNAVPGTAFVAGTAVWVVGSSAWPECIDDTFCGLILDCIQNAESICFTAIPEANEEQDYHLFGGSGTACVEGEEVEEQSCLNKILNVVYRTGALCYKNRSGVDGSGSDSGPKSFVVNDPDGGCDRPLILPEDPTGVWRYCDGELQFVENGRLFRYEDELLFEDAAYPLSVGDSAEVIDLTGLVNGIPDSCGGRKQAMFHVQVFAKTLVSADFFDYSIKIEDADVLRFGGNEQYASEAVVPFPAHNDNCVPVEFDGDSVIMTVNVETSGISGNNCHIKVWLRGWLI